MRTHQWGLAVREYGSVAIVDACVCDAAVAPKSRALPALILRTTGDLMHLMFDAVPPRLPMTLSYISCGEFFLFSEKYDATH